jgi:hypothetical protein
VLALIKSTNAWITTAAEISTWWEKRSKVTIDEGEYEISVYFPDDLDHFTLQIFGEAKIKEIDGVTARIEDNTIKFSAVKANSIAVVRLL